MDKLQVNSKQVKDFYKIMANKYDCEIVDKEDDLMMEAIGYFLDGIGVMDKEDFLNNFTTTLYDNIYVPFEIGNNTECNLNTQISILIHELVHVRQFKEAKIKMPLAYLVNSADRAMYESEAWSGNIEFLYKRGYTITEKYLDHYSNKFKKYGGNSKDILVIKNKMKSDLAMIKQNIPLTPEVTQALEILRNLGAWVE